jgi:hypothetical protein
MAMRSSLVQVRPDDEGSMRDAAEKLASALRSDQAVALPAEYPGVDVSLLWAEIAPAASNGAPVIPAAVVGAKGRNDRSETWVCFGEPVPAGTDVAAIAAAVRRLAETSME